MRKPLVLLLTAAAFAAAVALAQPPRPQPVGKLPGNKVTTRERGEDRARVMESNGIPDHTPGRFPNRGNPNAIREQHYSFRIPTDPKPADRPAPVRMNLFGVALNGVPFDPSAAEWWRRDRASGWQYEAMGGSIDLGLDESNAHVQPNGAYHYHGVPTGLVKKLGGDTNAMRLVGYAADGFPIYSRTGYKDAADPMSGLKTVKPSYRLKPGERPDGPGGKYDGRFTQDWEYAAGAGDLDECNGRTGPTPEYPKGTYHYFLTDDYPFVPRFWHGTPDPSFIRRGPPPGGRPRPPE